MKSGSGPWPGALTSKEAAVTRAWLCVVCLVVSGVVLDGFQAAGAADDVTRARAEIAKTRAAYEDAWRQGNAEAVAALYADDGVVLYPHQPRVSGRAAILGYFKGFFAQFRPETFVLSSEEVEVAGQWAFDRGTYRLAITPRQEGAPVADNGKYLVILRRSADGSWKVARDMDNTDLPLDPPR